MEDVNSIVAELARKRTVERIMRGVLNFRHIVMDDTEKKDIAQDIYVFMLGYGDRLRVAQERGRLTELTFWTVDNWLRPKSRTMYRRRVAQIAKVDIETISDEECGDIIG